MLTPDLRNEKIVIHILNDPRKLIYMYKKTREGIQCISTVLKFHYVRF